MPKSWITKVTGLTADFGPRTSDFGPWTSTPNVRPRTSDFRTSDLGLRTPDLHWHRPCKGAHKNQGHKKRWTQRRGLSAPWKRCKASRTCASPNLQSLTDACVTVEERRFSAA